MYLSISIDRSIYRTAGAAAIVAGGATGYIYLDIKTYMCMYLSISIDRSIYRTAGAAAIAAGGAGLGLS